MEGAADAAAAAAAGLLGFLGSAAAADPPLPPFFLASSHGVTQARAEAWRALSSDSAEALFWFGGIGGGREGRNVRREIFSSRGDEVESAKDEEDDRRSEKDDLRDRNTTFESSQVILGAFACFEIHR